MKTIYLDNNATTAQLPAVTARMDEILLEGALNASSTHRSGRKAKALLTDARRNLADFLQARSDQLIFTSGGTESMNFLIRSAVKNHHALPVSVSPVEHPCVDETLKAILTTPAKKLPLTSKGIIDIKKMYEEFNYAQILIVGYANSETGIIAPIKELSDFAIHTNSILIVDGVQGLTKAHIHLYEGICAMGFSSHKCHGPKGVGMCYLKNKDQWTALLNGGPQEFSLRAGTENIAAICGFERAVAAFKQQEKSLIEEIKQKRDLFEEKLVEGLGNHIEIIGKPVERLCNTSLVVFKNISGETLHMLIDQKGVMASFGTACNSGALKPSKTLSEMGIPVKQSLGALRFSLSRFTTEDEVKLAARWIIEAASQLNAISLQATDCDQLLTK